MYEYMITFGREVELFWTGRLTGAAILFFFNRYLSLVVDVYGLLENMYVPDKVSRRNDLPGPVDAVFSSPEHVCYADVSTFVIVLCDAKLGVNLHPGMQLSGRREIQQGTRYPAILPLGRCGFYLFHAVRSYLTFRVNHQCSLHYGPSR